MSFNYYIAITAAILVSIIFFYISYNTFKINSSSSIDLK